MEFAKANLFFALGKIICFIYLCSMIGKARNILVILLTALGCTGCTPTDNHTPSTQTDETRVDEHDHILYYDKEKDTVMTYEELQKQYDEYISLAWKSKLEGSLTDVLQHYERAIQFNDSIQKLIQTESIHSEEYQQMKDENARMKLIHNGAYIIATIILLLFVAENIYIQKRKRNIEMDKQQQLRIATFKQSELYAQILQAAKDDHINISPISQPVLWVAIQENLDELYADFTKRLLAQCPDLSETEQQICWLSKLNVQPSGIARILKLSRQAITNARSRIAKKMASNEGGIANFAHFIEKF